MVNLGSWMNKILVGWGVDAKIANTFDEMIIAVLPVSYTHLDVYKRQMFPYRNEETFPDLYPSVYRAI